MHSKFDPNTEAREAEQLEKEAREFEEQLDRRNVIEVKRTAFGYTKVFCSFKSSSQIPSFLVIKEFYDMNGNIEHANILYTYK